MQSKPRKEALWFLSKTLLASTDSPMGSRNTLPLNCQTRSTRTAHASSSPVYSLAFLRVETCKQPY
jgi:hypothetical protein